MSDTDIALFSEVKDMKSYTSAVKQVADVYASVEKVNAKRNGEIIPLFWKAGGIINKQIGARDEKSMKQLAADLGMQIRKVHFAVWLNNKHDEAKIAELAARGCSISQLMELMPVQHGEVLERLEMKCCAGDSVRDVRAEVKKEAAVNPESVSSRASAGEGKAAKAATSANAMGQFLSARQQLLDSAGGLLIFLDNVKKEQCDAKTCKMLVEQLNTHINDEHTLLETVRAATESCKAAREHLREVRSKLTKEA